MSLQQQHVRPWSAIWLAMSLLLGLLLTGVPAAAAPMSAGSFHVTGLTVDGLTDPLGVGAATPHLSWQLAPAASGATQAAYEVRVATSMARLAAGEPDVWDSGKVASAKSADIAYGGAALRSREQLVWQVRAWDSDGQVSTWSAPGTWEMGLLNPSDWSAKWITHPDWLTESSGSQPAALPVFAHPFGVAGNVARARLYIAGLGIYVPTVNGQQAGPGVLEPGNTNYRTDVQYRDYDVTQLLRNGGNAIGVQLGNGIYNVVPTQGRYAKFTGSMGTPRLIAQLEITYADGHVDTIGSGSTWRTALGPTTTSTWYGGEDYDARRTAPGWDQPGADLSGPTWTTAAATTPPAGTTALVPHAGPPVQVMDTLQPRAITQPKPGTYVFDMGVNFAGWEQLTVSGPAGTKVTMSPGELLNPDGTVYQSNSDTGAPIYDTYTLSGSGTETWHPQFEYHGFRYLQVTGLPAAPDSGTVTGLVLRAANQSAGSFSSSDTLLNGIHGIINRAVQSNMQSIVTDCPDREKLGWLEDGMESFDAIADNFDVSAYEPVIVRNMAEAQTSSGLVPDIAPEYTVFAGPFRDDPNWGDSMILMPWELYVTYGDISTMRTYYPNMQRYLDYLTSQASGGRLAYGLGDWGAIDTSTPVGITATYAYYMSARTMSQAATALGHSADAARYAALAQQIADAFNTAYLNPTAHTYGGGSQAADALALDMNVVPSDQRQAVLDHLVSTIRTDGNHVSVGEVALSPLFRALQAGGRDDVLYDIATQTTYPSYGFLIAHGATSMTEFWAGPTGSSPNSQDHEMLGGIDAWFTSGLAGIQQAPGSVGYSQIVVKPAVVGGLTHVSGSYRTPHGEVDSAWTVTRAAGAAGGAGIELHVTIPAGTSATVDVPASATDQITVSGTAGATRMSPQDGYVPYTAGPGIYNFTVQPAGNG